MRTFLFCLLSTLSAFLTAQTVDHPSFKTRSGSIMNITRIERIPERTRVHIHAVFRPHWWISIDGTEYLEDVATGKKYRLKEAEGVEIQQKIVMPDSGEKDFVLLFEPLPQTTESIHYLAPDSENWNTYDISLVPSKESSLMESIKGNWFEKDGKAAWAYGFYDSVTIMNNRMYCNERLRKKGKKVELTVRDKTNGQRHILLITPQKNGECLITTKENATGATYTRQRGTTGSMTPDDGFQQFFRNDSACLQGYIDGYDPRLKFDTGIIYLSNEITREECPMVVSIDKDGCFYCRFALSYPIEQSININNTWVPFFIEPGQTLTMYISWEDMMARSRARDHTYPLSNTAYMGPSAELSYLLSDFEQRIDYYSNTSQLQKELTPQQYIAHMKPSIARWEQTADSVCQCHPNATKAIALIKNKVKLTTANIFFNFELFRSFSAQQDTANAVLKVKADDDYYDFLREMPLNDPIALADKNTGQFINRLEYMSPLLNISYTMKEEEAEAAKDSIAARLHVAPSSLFWQIAKIRRLAYNLKTTKEKEKARQQMNTVMKKVTDPFLTATAEQLFNKFHPAQGSSTSYQLPEGKATEIFRNILRQHAGKVLFVDFWGTTCGPCRSGIEATAELRKQYKNHPDFQFIYITGENESPAKDYLQYVEKHLKGEASYYVSEKEYLYLRQLFHFNGIPHYELVEKDGSISREELHTYNIGMYLEKRFGDISPTEEE